MGELTRAGSSMLSRIMSAIFGPYETRTLPSGERLVSGGDESCGFSMVDPEDSWFATPERRAQISAAKDARARAWNKKYPDLWPRCEICMCHKANCRCGTWPKAMKGYLEENRRKEMIEHEPQKR